ncbi:hypothetical protein BJI49_13665 [Acetobacter pasteurianus]|jgi:hypothetical protein|uniref:Uncharacterized protein n=2 Tax=Acetobacteraceae TaxID=433 RepID=A0A967B928_9PROT|nr:MULTISPECIES: hypothetical protein [Acetobacteraceae]RCL04325.1 hypothetical protein BJI49_13665 [Acetobacter pasteurianus]MBF0866069.1 hypothetical protein [Gluconobacter sp. R71656]MBF0869040.1 hypothetical protein [Gluconobacter sp. R75628]MBF0875040.1 hypothetical protein [Gluconobacter sp. R75629]MBF0884103.1 hypothetical protein [Gluconobacter potus]
MTYLASRRVAKHRHVYLAGPDLSVLAVKESRDTAARSAVQLARRRGMSVSLWAMDLKLRPGSKIRPRYGIYLGEAHV